MPEVVDGALSDVSTFVGLLDAKKQGDLREDSTAVAEPVTEALFQRYAAWIRALSASSR
jgi:hypothetical protein